MSSTPDSTSPISSTPASVPATPITAIPPSAPLCEMPNFKDSATLYRVGIIVCCILMFICFFTPQFYASMSVKDESIPTAMRDEYYRHWAVWGWSTWWGWLSFIGTLLITPVLLADLFSPAVRGLRSLLRFAIPAAFVFLLGTTGLGFLLGLFGLDMGYKRHYLGSAGPGPADYSHFRFPITVLFLLLVTAIALGISAAIMLKEMKQPASEIPPSTPPAP